MDIECAISNGDSCYVKIYQFCFRGMPLSFLYFYLSESFKYSESIVMMMKQRKVKIPYEGYKLPPSAEQGGQFVDFKRVIERKPVKVVRKKK